MDVEVVSEKDKERMLNWVVGGGGREKSKEKKRIDTCLCSASAMWNSFVLYLLFMRASV